MDMRFRFELFARLEFIREESFMYMFTFLVREQAGNYCTSVFPLDSLADAKRTVLAALRCCRRQVLSAVLIIRDVQSGGEYWIDTYQ